MQGNGREGGSLAKGSAQTTAQPGLEHTRSRQRPPFDTSTESYAVQPPHLGATGHGQAVCRSLEQGDALDSDAPDIGPVRPPVLLLRPTSSSD